MTKREAKIEAYNRVLAILNELVADIEDDAAMQINSVEKAEIKVAIEVREIARQLQVKAERFA